MNLFQKRLSLGVGMFFGALVSLGLLFGVFDTASRGAGDRFFLPRETTSNVLIVAIDDESLGRIGRWPWDRSVHADLVSALSEAGASVIALDVNFPESSTLSEDRALSEAIERAGNVILPVELSFETQPGTPKYNPNRVVAPIREIQNAVAALGFSNTPLDSDGIVRRVPLFAESDDTRVYGFAYQTGRFLETVPSMSEIPLDQDSRMIVHFPNTPGKGFERVKAADVIDGSVSPDRIQGKTVFIGATARDLHDEQNVPTSAGNPMSGVEIHASIYDTLHQRAFLREVSPWWHIVLFLLIGAGLGILVPRVRARTSLFITIGLYITWLIAAFILFDRGWILDIVWIGILLVFAYLGLLLERWITTERERRRTRDAFSRYVSPNVVESIMQNIEDLKLGGARRNMTVLFSDLRGFTSLSEGLKPEELVQILNRYLHEMTDIVFEEGGVLDKYIGDAVMAFWNAPFDQDDHAMRAVRTAIKMKEKLKEMNDKRVFGDIQLRVGIGLNTGEMVVGNIGGERRYDYTVIGDSVNTASRTEGLCKPYGVEIIVTEYTKNELDDAFAFRRLDRVAVKGKKEPMRIYEVLGFAGSVSDADKQFVVRYEKALDAYFDRRFKTAKTLCEEALNMKPEDATSIQLLERIEAFIKRPPSDDWNGVWVLTSK